MKKTRLIPRLNQCFLCKSWTLESSLEIVEVPDQAGYVKKLACESCLDGIGVKREENPDDLT